jgi:voltage-gated potassium channel Kch
MRSSMMTLKKSWIRFLKLQERSREPGLSALMFIEGTLIFVIIPLASVGMMPGFVLAAMFILLVLATLVVTSRSHWAAGVVLIAVLLSPVGAFVHAEHPTAFTESLSLGARLLALSALSVVIARAVFGPGRVTWHRVQGAIVLYMNFALFFFTLYRFLNTLMPDAFHGLPQSGAEHGSGAALLYFSFSTLTTVGYGDITPVYPLARNLANLEAVIGQLFPATLLARLVSLEIEHRRQSKSG